MAEYTEGPSKMHADCDERRRQFEVSVMRDSSTRFGAVSIALHWVLALSYMGLFGIGWYMVTLDYYDPMYTLLPDWHKSVGMLMVLVLAVHLVWRSVNAKPEGVAGLKEWEQAASISVHWMLFAGTALVLMTGYLIPTAEGAVVSIFGFIEIPALIHSLPGQEDTAGEIHKYLAYVVLGLAALHAAAAFKHHFVDKDNTLRRMLVLKEKVL